MQGKGEAGRASAGQVQGKCRAKGEQGGTSAGQGGISAGRDGQVQGKCEMGGARWGDVKQLKFSPSSSLVLEPSGMTMMAISWLSQMDNNIMVLHLFYIQWPIHSNLVH